MHWGNASLILNFEYQNETVRTIIINKVLIANHLQLSIINADATSEYNIITGL